MPSLPLDDPSRARVGNRPTWAAAPNIVLPSLVLTPRGPGLWQLQLMFPDPEKGFSFFYLSRDFAATELALFLDCWWASPEDTVRTYWGVEPPSGKVWHFARAPEVAGETTATLSELGL